MNSNSYRYRLGFVTLEERAVPAVNIAFDYAYDTNNFFNTPAKRATLQAAADAIGSQLGDTLSAISPGGGNTWTAQFSNPSTGADATATDLNVAQNQLIVYVGGRNFSSSELGIGGPGGFSASGSSAWLNNVTSRGQGNTQGASAGDTGPWGGSITFDLNPGQGGWFFSSAGGTLGSNQFDFYSVASHELGHLLGLGTADSWTSKVSGSAFVGPTATGVFGSNVPLYGDRAHWADGTTSQGLPAVMDPIIAAGVQTHYTALDQAALKDIGWQIAVTASPGVPVLPAAPAEVTPSLYAVAGGFGSISTVEVYNSDNTVRFTITPFGNYAGNLRVAAGDVSGDGTQDLIVAAGPGAGPHIKVFDGKTGAEIASFYAFDSGFQGGISIAAGDITGGGHAAIIVGTLSGADPHVVAYDGITHALLRSFDAFLPSFRGGINVAAGFVGGPGHADIIASVASAGPPHVVVFDGLSNALLRSFYAYSPNFLGGVFVAAGDVNGDLRADIIITPAGGASDHVQVFSGNDGSILASFFADGSGASTSGARVAAEALGGLTPSNIIVATGRSNNPAVRIFAGPSVLASANPQAANLITNFNFQAANGLFVA